MVDQDIRTEEGDVAYAIIADPRERTIDIEEDVDGVLCTGDVLNLAPPPDESPEGSLYAEIVGKEGYKSGDVDRILQNIADMSDTVTGKAIVRYERFLDTVDEPFYTVMGNQDIPEAYGEKAVSSLEDLEKVHGVDGVVPVFSDLPEGVFPTEISEESFYDQVKEASGDILLSHSLPDSFDPEQYGFNHAYCSPSETDRSYASDDVTELRSYYTSGAYEIIHM